MNWNYEQIKAEAKRGRQENLGYSSVKDLIALALNNDPFYMGSARDHELAKWFSDIWFTFGYTNNIHLRRIHYQIISQDAPVSFPDGLPYKKN